MFVVKRDGRKEPIMFDKITARIRKLNYGLNPLVDPVRVAMRVIEGLYDGVTTSELDNLAAEIAATMTTTHPDYAKLAARISVSNLHKNTKKSFSATMKDLYEYVNPRTGKKAPLLSDEVYAIIEKNADKIDSSIIYNRDFGYDFFGFKTLERSYLLKLNGQIVERPQHMLMRVSIGIHLTDLDAAFETYELMSKRYFTHATPTLFNSGTPKPQMSSCFLLTMKDDSIDGIYDTLKQTAKISQSAGGIGLSIHNIRATGSYIAGTNGTSNGIVPMLRVFNSTARYVNQAGRRKGSFAMYLEALPLVIIGYTLLFGDLITATEVLNDGQKSRPDEPLDINLDRSHLSIAVRNFLGLLVAWPLAKQSLVIFKLDSRILFSAITVILLITNMYVGSINNQMFYYLVVLLISSYAGYALKKYDTFPFVFAFILHDAIISNVYRFYLLNF